MKTYQASKLFNHEGELATKDPLELATMIVEAEIGTIASDHDSKLVRIEIGCAIRAIAIEMKTTLTEAISTMGLCITLNRAEKTFLKYARIAGSPTLMRLAENPQISLSVLDEIAACKKPAIKSDLSKFLKKVCAEVVEICDKNLEDEGFQGEAGRLVVLGVTRNEAVGVIRRNQIEMGVKTRPGAGGSPDRPGIGEIHSKTLQLLNLMRVLTLPTQRRNAWLEKHGILLDSSAALAISLTNDLVEAGIIAENADDLKPESIKGLVRLARDEKEVAEVI
jgi:hypothetical protein